jgi:hypothetical protein
MCTSRSSASSTRYTWSDAQYPASGSNVYRVLVISVISNAHTTVDRHCIDRVIGIPTPAPAAMLHSESGYRRQSN